MITTKKKKQRNICGGDLKAPVDCSDNEMMIKENIHLPLFELNKMYFYKTREEREIVKKLKRTQHLSSNKSGFNDIHRKPTHRLIVHIKNQDHLKDFHTTANYSCKEHEVKDILSLFHEKQLVTSVKFNGKEINNE